MWREIVLEPLQLQRPSEQRGQFSGNVRTINTVGAQSFDVILE
ncbi:MAG: hypothetical protein ABR529_06105 [Actinomycetota bacterium]